MAKSKRQLNVRVQLGALNIVLYPDRFNTTSTLDTPDTPGSNNPGVPTSQPSSLQMPSQIANFAFAYGMQANPKIGAPAETFLYGTLTPGSNIDLLTPPAGSEQTFFPFSQNYNSYLNTVDSASKMKFTALSRPSNTSVAPDPFIPSRSTATNQTVPRLTSYNFWVATDSSGAMDVTNVAYFAGANPVVGSGWLGGSFSQTVDNSGQASIAFDSRDNKSLVLRRMFALNSDTLYQPEATLVYPSGSGFNSVKINVDSDNLTVINPKENCSWYTQVIIDDVSGSLSDNNNFRGFEVQWGDIDAYKQSSKNTDKIVYYKLKVSDSKDPLLEFWHPVSETMKQIQLVGPRVDKQKTIDIYTWYVGNVLCIGFDADPLQWNVIGSIEPEDTNQKGFLALYHWIPGGTDNPKNNSSIAISFSNVSGKLKYSALAFNNITSHDSTDSNDFFSDAGDAFKKQISRKFSISSSTHKTLSQSVDSLNNYFYGKGLLKDENIYNTSSYIKKVASKYFNESDRLTATSRTNNCSQFWSGDPRLFSPYDDDYNGSNCWPIKIKINNPNYNAITSQDKASSSTADVSFIFNHPVYSGAFHGFTLAFLDINSIPVPTITSVPTTTTSSLSAKQQDHIVAMLNTDGVSYKDDQRGVLKTPVFEFVHWGDISDLVDANSITITHQATQSVMGASTCSFTMNNLIFSNRGTNILNLLENNILTVSIRAGYSNDPDNLEMFFQGVVNGVTTTRSPLGSTHSIQCSDWLNDVLNNSRSLSTFALQGMRIRDRIKIGLNLAGISRYFEIIDQNNHLLHEDPFSTDQYNIKYDPNSADYIFSDTMNYRQGNATSKVAAQNLSETIDTDNTLMSFVQESLEFVVEDSAISIMYENLRDNEERDDYVLTNGDKNPFRKIVVENRFLPANSTENPNAVRFRDELNFLLRASNVQYYDDNWKALGGPAFDPNIIFGQIDKNIGGQMNINDSYTDFSVEDFHGTIISPITFTSDVKGLFEGVYIIAVGVGKVPLFHVRSSDSYFLADGNPSNTPDWLLYQTALNRSYIGGFWSNGIVFDFFNVLDVMDVLPVNNEYNPLLRAAADNNRFDMGYVGYRKRFIDDQKQTYIQTNPDLIKRGNLWAQYIRKVPQTISFDVFVTKPLQHYNNFIIKHFDSNTSLSSKDSKLVGRLTVFPEIFEEFSNFLYESVTYNINKNANTIIATVKGGPVPKINPESASS